MTTRAQWISGIPDLYSTLDTARSYLNIAQVSELTGFSPTTITDLLSREPITSPTNPLGALSRPAARIGVNPLYSNAQVEDCLRRRQVNTDLNLGGMYHPLPKVTAKEAAQRNLISVTEIAELAGVHEQTVRKWKARNSTFPPPVALRERDEDGHSGVPFVVHEKVAVARWLRNRTRGTRTHGGRRSNPAAPTDRIAV
jgi:predicted DNA-binding transcriptional regulator AlpA